MSVEQGFSFIQPLLLDSNRSVRKAAAEILTEIIKTVPHVAEEVLPLIKPLVIGCWDYMEARERLTEVVKAMPVEQGLSLIQPLLSDRSVRQAAVETLT